MRLSSKNSATRWLSFLRAKERLPIEIMVRRLSPENEHPMPVAEAWDGQQWTVDIQIRVGKMDIDGTGRDRDIERARAKALQRIRKTRTMYELHGYVPN